MLYLSPIGLPASSLAPLQIIHYNVDRIIFSKCISDHATHLISHVAEFKDFTLCSALCKIVYQTFKICSELSNCLPSIYFLGPTLLFASYPAFHPLFLYSCHISPLSVSRCAMLFSSGSLQTIFLCAECFFLYLCPYLANFNSSFKYQCKHHFLSQTLLYKD